MLQDMPFWTNVVVGLVTLQAAYTIYAVISRIFLSPLRRIPGPKLAALTSWYEFYFDAIEPGKFVWKIRDLHSEYGLAASPGLETFSLMCAIRRPHRADYTLGGPCERR